MTFLTLPRRLVILNPRIKQSQWRLLLSSCRHTSSVSFPRVGVVGSGPAGFYFTAALRRLVPNVKVDIFEALPAPFGLIRYGVAPDHPEVKNAEHAFERLMDSQAASCRFFGNITVGRDIPLQRLAECYDAIVLAYGAQTERKLSIGRTAKNVFSARNFVGWYNGVPEDADLQPDLTRSDTAVILGHGNVALDVARMLLRPVDFLRTTDICEHALQTLSESRIRRVILVGRRGPLQVAFTIKEIREMISALSSHGQRIIPDLPRDAFETIGAADVISKLPRPRKRLTNLMADTAMKLSPDDLASADRTWSLKFMRTPKIVVTDDNGVVTAARFDQNKFLPGCDDLERCAEWRVEPIDNTEDTIQCGLIVSSIGYQSHSIDRSLPFNTSRSVLDVSPEGRIPSDQHTLHSQLYACGWCARGPVGVLNTTQMDASGLAKIVAGDLEALSSKGADSALLPDAAALISDLGVKYVAWKDWRVIDTAEQAAGAPDGKPREKITSVSKMLEITKKH